MAVVVNLGDAMSLGAGEGSTAQILLPRAQATLDSLPHTFLSTFK